MCRPGRALINVTGWTGLLYNTMYVYVLQKYMPPDNQSRSLSFLDKPSVYSVVCHSYSDYTWYYMIIHVHPNFCCQNAWNGHGHPHFLGATNGATWCHHGRCWSITVTATGSRRADDTCGCQHELRKASKAEPGRVARATRAECLPARTMRWCTRNGHSIHSIGKLWKNP